MQIVMNTSATIGRVAETLLCTAYRVLICSAVMGISLAQAENCTEEQAFNKMMALNRAQGRMMNEGNPTIDSPSIKLAQESAPLGELIAQKKFSEACTKYEALAKKYGVDLVKESEGMLTYAELAKDGGKRGGECGVAEASKKMMAMHEQLQDKVALGDESSDVFNEFGKDTSTFGELMVTNPNEVCKKLEALKPKYKLQ